jgi:hypothetical protein
MKELAVKGTRPAKHRKMMEKMPLPFLPVSHRKIKHTHDVPAAVILVVDHHA